MGGSSLFLYAVLVCCLFMKLARRLSLGSQKKNTGITGSSCLLCQAKCFSVLVNGGFIDLCPSLIKVWRAHAVLCSLEHNFHCFSCFEDTLLVFLYMLLLIVKMLCSGIGLSIL